MIFGRGRPSLKVSGEGMPSEMMAGVSEGVCDFFLLKTMMMARQRRITGGICNRCTVDLVVFLFSGVLRSMSQLTAAGTLQYDVGLLGPLSLSFWLV